MQKIINNQLSIINRKGAALLVVLFIVMAITILSLGFLSRSDVELACGENMILRTQMDYLAESGLEHARGLILNPQDVDTEYWTGDVRQQLVAGSDDYYDVNVVKVEQCNYQITSSAYREKGGEEVGRGSLTAELRLDPAIAFWVNASTTIASGVTINGDVYCNGNLVNNGIINGDVYADSLSGAKTGQRYPANEADVNDPGLEIGDFPSYYIDPDTHYPQTLTVADYNNISWPAVNGTNPAGVFTRDGNLELSGNILINGTLIVNGNLTIKEDPNNPTAITITPVKNFPALVVNNLTIEQSCQLTINGLAQVDTISVLGGSEDITILGALFVRNSGISTQPSYSGNINIIAAPAKASIQIRSDGAGDPQNWSPAASAFFRSIERVGY